MLLQPGTNPAYSQKTARILACPPLITTYISAELKLTGVQQPAYR